MRDYWAHSSNNGSNSLSWLSSMELLTIKRQTSISPFLEAVLSGVSPYWSDGFLFWTDCMISLHISRWPLSAAKWRGVKPQSVEGFLSWVESMIKRQTSIFFSVQHVSTMVVTFKASKIIPFNKLKDFLLWSWVVPPFILSIFKACRKF